MKKLLSAALLALLAVPCVHAQYVTLSGTLQASNGLTASNYTISFKLSQMGFIAGTGVFITPTTFCATSTDGTVVGLPNPLVPSVVTPAFSGSLPPANYYIKYAFYSNAGTITLVSPETVANLTGTGELFVAPPISGIPAGAVGMKVYIGTTSGSETLQGVTVGNTVYTQSTALVSGAAMPATNNTVCAQVANDAIWPVGTGYNVSLIDSSGNTLPGYPMMWQLLGPNTAINLANGLPYYHGVVTYPVPILASPLNHSAQSISGPLSLTSYNLLNVGNLGVGTGLPAWPIDVENGIINASGGFLVNGSAGSNLQCLASNGSAVATFVNCLTNTNGINYQIIRQGSTNFAGRQTLGFGPGFTVTDVVSAPARTVIGLDNTIPTVGTGAVSQAVCQFSVGPPIVLGHCTSAVNSSGACTCAN